MSAFNTRPIAIIIVTKLDLPYDISGNGVPTTGSRPEIIPMLIAIWKKNILATPIQTILPYLLFTLNAMK